VRSDIAEARFVIHLLQLALVMMVMVMEKYRDIAVLMSMGARRAQIRRIFMLQGVLIGVAGTVWRWDMRSAISPTVTAGSASTSRSTR
jgi:predicted lysophospholipase L1 biosynthesis ABC-type transport system permease subunit